MVFVQAQRVDAPGARLARGVPAGNEANVEQRLQVGRDQCLKWLFQVGRAALQFGGEAYMEADEFDVAHVFGNPCSRF